MSPDQIVPDGSIVITPAEVYGKVTGLISAVDRLIIQNEGVIRDRAEDRVGLKEVEARVSALERKVWMIAGGAATLGGTLGSWLPSALGH